MNQSQLLLAQSESSGSSRGSTNKISVMERVSTRILSWFSVAEGYEDENGFHYGPQPKPAWLTALGSAESRPIFTDRAEDAIFYVSAAATQPAESPAESHHPAAL